MFKYSFKLYSPKGSYRMLREYLSTIRSIIACTVLLLLELIHMAGLLLEEMRFEELKTFL